VGRVKKRLTITEASGLTGLSRKALARRIERGQLGATMENGRRYIDAKELAQAGLLNLQTGEPPAWRGRLPDPEAVASELVQTLIGQTIEIYELRQSLELLRRESRRDDELIRDQLREAKKERAELREQLERADQERAELRRQITKKPPQPRRRA
jgi:chromosome segregation ATPase